MRPRSSRSSSATSRRSAATCGAGSTAANLLRSHVRTEQRELASLARTGVDPVAACSRQYAGSSAGFGYAAATALALIRSCRVGRDRLSDDLCLRELLPLGEPRSA